MGGGNTHGIGGERRVLAGRQRETHTALRDAHVGTRLQPELAV